MHVRHTPARIVGLLAGVACLAGCAFYTPWVEYREAHSAYIRCTREQDPSHPRDCEDLRIRRDRKREAYERATQDAWGNCEQTPQGCNERGTVPIR